MKLSSQVEPNGFELESTFDQTKSICTGMKSSLIKFNLDRQQNVKIYDKKPSGRLANQ